MKTSIEIAGILVALIGVAMVSVPVALIAAGIVTVIVVERN